VEEARAAARRLLPLEEAGKCMFCGFCEPACPTLPLGPHRGYGPRGRLAIAAMVAGGLISDGALESLYTCLLCGACNEACPAGIDIVAAIREARAAAAESLSGPGGGRY